MATNSNLEEARDILSEEREHLTLGQQPIRTASRFGVAALRWVTHNTALIARRPVVRKVVLPLSLALLLISRFIIPDEGIWRECEYLLADGLFWLVLGVLSSIGLGTGMHSGVLFLFPHIYLTCAAATTCGGTNFWTYPSNPLYGPRDRRFVCVTTGSSPTAAGASFWQCLLKVIPACVMWGAGTAIGEVPPYALSYAAALQGKKQQALENTEETSRFDVMNRMKQWTLNKIERYGFWAIFLLAAWPNMAFDLCGMACGQFMMPFWTFFGATFLGKALIKVNMQAVFFVLLFSGDNMERMAQRVGTTLASFLPARLDASAGVQKAVAAIGSARDSIRARATGAVHGASPAGSADEAGSLIMMLMQWVVTLAVLWFAKSIVDTFAQGEQERRDEETIARLATVLREEGCDRTRLGRGELRQLLDRIRPAGSSRRCAALPLLIRRGLGIYPLIGLVAVGLATSRSWIVVLGTNLLFHRFLFVHMSSNFSLSPWQAAAVRLAMASVVVYGVYVDQRGS